MRLRPIHEQVVVLFGASSGIGRAAALRFAEQGARVVVAARSREGLESLVAEIQHRGGHATAFVAEASDSAQVRAVADRTVQRYGRLDTWVHLAAVSLYAYFWDTPPHEFKRVIDVNLIGQAYGAMAALPHMRQRGGALIHISSIEARRAFPYQSAYAAAKHGIAGFLESLRVELRQANIPVSVTNIMPASINTPLFSKARTRLGVKPMGIPPIYQPDLVADAILYAAEHPTRDIIVGGSGKLFDVLQRISPAMVDEILLRSAFTGQRTDEPESVEAPDNLYAPIGGYNRVEGDFSDQAKSASLGTWLELHPQARRMLSGVAATGLAMLIGRMVQQRA